MLMRRVWPARTVFGNPFDEFEQLRRGMLRLLESAGERGDTLPSSQTFPQVNVSQDDDNFFVRAVLPGVKASELTITALRNRLSIGGRREIPREIEKVSYHRRERVGDAFSRTITLPSEIRTDKVDARYADGVLTLTLPKAEESRPRQIAVKS